MPCGSKQPLVFDEQVKERCVRIFRYLFKEVSSSFFAVAIVLLLIFVSSRFVKYLGDAAAGSISSDVLVWIMLYRLPGFLELILPLALFVGMMLVYGRLYVDSEMIVLQACGISKKRLLLYAQGPGLVVMLLVLLLTAYVTPLGWAKFHRIWNDPDNFSGLSTLVEGSFKRIGSGGAVIYTAGLNKDKTELTDVFVLRKHGDGENGRISVMRAGQAKVLNYSQRQRYIELYDGVEYSGTPGQLDYTVSVFSRYGQLLDTGSREIIEVDSVDAKPTAALDYRASAKERAALLWRIGVPLMVPVITLIALALSETSHRKGRYAKLLPGLLLYIFYLAAIVYSKNEVGKGNAFAELFFWLSHVGFLLLGFLLLQRESIARRWQARRHSCAS